MKVHGPATPTRPAPRAAAAARREYDDGSVTVQLFGERAAQSTFNLQRPRGVSARDVSGLRVFQTRVLGALERAPLDGHLGHDLERADAKKRLSGHRIPTPTHGSVTINMHGPRVEDAIVLLSRPRHMRPDEAERLVQLRRQFVAAINRGFATYAERMRTASAKRT